MLSDIDRKILDFERAWWRYPEPKVCTIRQLLGLDAADYYRRLGELMTTPEANTYDPLTVRRLVRWLGTGAA